MFSLVLNDEPNGLGPMIRRWDGRPQKLALGFTSCVGKCTGRVPDEVSGAICYGEVPARRAAYATTFRRRPARRSGRWPVALRVFSSGTDTRRSRKAHRYGRGNLGGRGFLVGRAGCRTGVGFRTLEVLRRRERQRVS